MAEQEKKLCLAEYVAGMPNERDRSWIKQLLSGASPEQISRESGRSLQQVNGVIWKFFYAKPQLQEDAYKEVFEAVAFTEQTFCAVSGQSAAVFFYLCHSYHSGKNAFAKEHIRLLPSADRERAKQYLEPKKGTGRRAASYSVKNKRAMKRIRARVQKEFDRKAFIGDIVVRDDEYEELVNYTRAQLRSSASHGYEPLKNDPLLAVALVQYGIRSYDGNYWSNVGKAVNMPITVQQQSFLGKSFVNTVQKHEKYLLSESDRVDSIMTHCFVSDFYAPGLFELLFSYYVRDLERDINRNTADQMEALLQTLEEVSEMDEKESEQLTAQFMGKGSRAYKLRKHTLCAIAANRIHSRTRLRRLLRLIDKAFWTDQVPQNPTSRLTIRFKEWRENSEAFRKEYGSYQSGAITNRGKKHFSSPTLFNPNGENKFLLKLPMQLVPRDTSDTIRWHISLQSGAYDIPVDTYPAVTGRKTDDCTYRVSVDDLFGEIHCTLLYGANERHFTIRAADWRLFDEEGDSSEKLFHIPMHIFTREASEIVSPALLDTVPFHGLRRWDLDLQDGDMVILPNGKSMVVGERYQEGLGFRYRVTEAHYEESGETLNVYSKAPVLLLTIPESKINGTLLMVNGDRHALRDCEYTRFENGDERGQNGILLSSEQFTNCKDIAVNEIAVDVPGHVYPKLYRFALIRDLSVQFFGAPYVFVERGTVAFPPTLPVFCPGADIKKSGEENAFNFPLSADREELRVEIGAERFPLRIRIPQFLWSADNLSWQLEAMGEIWHTAFPQKLYFRSPTDKFTLDTDLDGRDDEEDFQPLRPDRRETGYTMELIRLHSRMTRDKVCWNVTLRLEKKDYPFAAVYARSYVAWFETEADYETQQLFCRYDIIGQANYYLDVKHILSQTVVADKLLLPKDCSEISIPCDLPNGEYSVVVWEAEDEEDDFGFEESEYYEIYQRQETLINKNDLSGKSLRIMSFKPAHGSNQFRAFQQSYILPTLKRVTAGHYRSVMPAKGEESGMEVEVYFPNLDNLRYFELKYLDEDEKEYFLYDAKRGLLAIEEEKGLHYSEKYRRYAYLDDRFLFYGELTDILP